jgi:protein SCO1
MMRIILVGILVVMTAAVGWITFDWYRSQHATRAFGEPFVLVDHHGDAITEAAFRGHPSAVFFGFTYCPDVCPTTLFEMDAWLNELGPEGENIRAYFVSVDPERDTPEVLGRYITNVTDKVTGHHRRARGRRPDGALLRHLCAQGGSRRRRLHDRPHRLDPDDRQHG